MPLWESILLAGFGGGLAMTGTWTGFRLQAREARRIRSEQIAREDQLRLHSKRVESYSSFFREVGGMRATLRRRAISYADPEVVRKAREQRNALWDEYTILALVGAAAVDGAASEIVQLATLVAWGEADFDDERYGKLVETYVHHARADLLDPVIAGSTADGQSRPHPAIG